MKILKRILDIFYISKKKEIVKKVPTMMELPKGAKVWVMNPEELDKNGFDWFKSILHRENDLPAIEYSDGSKEWYKNGKIHRESDLPAIEDSDGTKYWYKEGKLHRENDLPAVEHSSGTKKWYKEGKRHRDNNKPAIIWFDGKKEYWVNGKRIK